MAKAAVVSAALAVACFTAGRAEPEQPQARVGALKNGPPRSVRLADGARFTGARSTQKRPATSKEALPPLKETEAGSARNSKLQCAAEMVRVERPQAGFCIDRWEASLERRSPSGSREPWPGNRAITGRQANMVAVSVKGRKPQGYVSGAEAARACANAGKRLCEIDEWVRACRGALAHTYSYGNQRQAGVCNDRYKLLDAHPVMVLFEEEAPHGTDPETMWGSEWMNHPRLHEMPRSVAATGSYPGCVSEAGAYDMVGNLHEWVADPEGTFVGGFFMDTYQNGEGCGYRTLAHDFNYRDYSTGFRCCRDAASD